MTEARLVETDLSGANITGSKVYGISVWNCLLTDTIQKDLIVTRPSESRIEVDRLEVAQFIYLLLNNAEIRHVIDTIASKMVLILGRLTKSHGILNTLRDALRVRNYLPVLFDFEKPSSRSITETVSTLAHMARFIVADITDARSIPQELMAIVPSLPSVPVQPLLLASQREYGMFEHFRRYPWVLPIREYNDEASLVSVLNRYVLPTLEAKALQLLKVGLN